MNDDIKELIALHKSFWEHELKKPIINDKYSLWRRQHYMVNIPGEIGNENRKRSILHEDWLGKDNMLIKPDMLSPARHQSYYEYDDIIDSLITYPVFNTIIPWTMVTWLPAIAGCDIKISEKGETLWPEPYIGKGWFELEGYGVKYNYMWLEKLKEFIRFLVDKYYPRRMVSLEMFSRGPLDILLSAMDNEVAYLSLFDKPQDIKNLLIEFAELHKKWSAVQLEMIPQLEGGYCNQWGIWAPGKITRLQEDFAINLSEKHYKEFVMPADNEVIEASEYQVFHTHSGHPEFASWVSVLDNLKVVEVTLDLVSPPLEELLPIWNKVLQKKSMIITGSFTEKQVKTIINKLDISGLFLDIVTLND